MIALREESTGNYHRAFVVRELNDEVLQRAKHAFAQYKLRGIIRNNDFDDNLWKICDEKSTKTLMRFNQQLQKIVPWVDCSIKEYRLCVKVYIALHFGELAPHTLQEIAREFFKLSSIGITEAAASDRYPNHVEAFLRLLPGGSSERDWVIEQLSERKSNIWRQDGKNRQRVLSDFKSYLRFHDVFSSFWQAANVDEKAFFFPLYFWWNLTAILPLRVTEFLLTPRNCFEEYDGKYSITIRRSKLKGSGKKIAYRIDGDYDLHKYEIGDKLGCDVRNYLETTKNMTPTALDTLFLIEPHRKYLSHRAIHRNRRYYTYQDLSDCMQIFYEEVILPSGIQINPIKLGDTRHLALINLIISGGSPVICRELAGHTNIDISSHYYANISNLVECATLEQLRKKRGGTAARITGSQKYTASKPVGGVRVTGGICVSEGLQKRNIEDCLKAAGPDGQIGNCIVCPHYHPDDQGLRFATGANLDARAAVDNDCHYLMQMIELVRKGLGYQEEIGTALLRLQHSSNRYSMTIQESFTNGKTKEAK